MKWLLLAPLAPLALCSSLVSRDPIAVISQTILEYIPPSIPSGDLADIVRSIPQYDTAVQSYNNTPSIDPEGRVFFDSHLRPMLEDLEAHQNADALAILGDIYTFGNFSTLTNYSKALKYYERSVTLKPNGHVYFILGVFYSTGMFGELQIDQAKAQLYYELGTQHNDINSIIAVAYRLLRGIGCPQNCQLAMVHYSKLAKLGYKYHLEHQDEIEETEICLNIKVPDFVGGIYGSEVSESQMSISESRKELVYNFEQEFSIDNFDRKLTVNFLNAWDQYDGYYDSPKNFTAAYELLMESDEFIRSLHGFYNHGSLSDVEKFRISLHQSLLGHVYLRGQGTPKNYEKAYEHLYVLAQLHNTSGTLSDLGYMYEKGLGVSPDPIKALSYYKAADDLKSEKAPRHIARFQISEIGESQIMSNPRRANIVESMRTACLRGDTQALFHYSEFIQAGYLNGVRNQPSCSGTLIYMRIFIERLHRYFFPHLEFALEELRKSNYKNALLGYAMAAEQGVERAQVSAGWLLYQHNVLMSKDKSFPPDRVSAAIKYFERASKQGDIDSTLLLGDIYYYGVPSAVEKSYELAFEYYSQAANSGSLHGCYSLAWMYEHGLGTLNNTIDYHMAKRYYDLSLKYKSKKKHPDDDDPNVNPIQMSLLWLRIKYLFFGRNSKSQDKDQSSWFSTLKKLGLTVPAISESQVDNSQQRAEAQHMDGEPIPNQDFGIADFFVLGITIFSFGFMFLRQLTQQVRQNGAAPAVPAEGQPEQQGQPAGQEGQQQGWQWNGNEVNFRRGNFEFHFFAL